jgi:shikimate kinase
MTDTPVPHRDSSPTGRGVPVRVIFLVGFMGAGKTSVGKVLAEALGWRFFDLDQQIEAREGLSVSEIFRTHGEQGFRDREHRALRALLGELSPKAPAVVALGGGAFVQAENAELLAAEGPSVFLDTPVDDLWQRCSELGEPERPLRTDAVAFRALHDQRRAHYLRSTLKVDTRSKTVQQVAQEVIARLDIAQASANKENRE